MSYTINTTERTMTRKSHWMKDKNANPNALGVYIKNWQELGQEGLCQADDWMLERQPNTKLDSTCAQLAQLVAVNNHLAGNTDVANKIKKMLQSYADEGDQNAKTAVAVIEFSTKPKERNFQMKAGS